MPAEVVALLGGPGCRDAGGSGTGAGTPSDPGSSTSSCMMLVSSFSVER